MKGLSAALLAGVVAAAPNGPPSYKPSNPLSSIISSLETLLKGDPAETGPFAPVTSEIIQDYVEPIEVSHAITFVFCNEVLTMFQAQLLRNSYVVREGTELQLGGKHWTSSGGNVYWLGLDENVIPPAGQPFYAPFNASYPTKGRITEVMNTLVTMGVSVAYKIYTLQEV